jgi:hypothetical protein
MEGQNEVHRICKTTSTDVLLASHADVDQDPKDQTRPEFIEIFYVETPYGRVKLTSDEELYGSI